jgi:ketosteroid isomerase-like protein
MPEENVEVVRKAIDVVNAFMRGELSREAFAEPWDPQAEWHWHDRRTYPDLPQNLRGPEVIEFGEQLRGAWVDLATELLEFIEAPDGRVVTLIRQSGRGRESGVPVEVHFFQLWTVRDGKVRKIEVFGHRADALEAAGLSE